MVVVFSFAWGIFASLGLSRQLDADLFLFVFKSWRESGKAVIFLFLSCSCPQQMFVAWKRFCWCTHFQNLAVWPLLSHSELFDVEQNHPVMRKWRIFDVVRQLLSSNSKTDACLFTFSKNWHSQHCVTRIKTNTWIWVAVLLIFLTVL